MQHDILPPDHVIVTAATDALTAFAGMDLDRTLASILLPAWVHMATLTDREVRSILIAFPEPADPGPDSWLSDRSLRGEPR